MSLLTWMPRELLEDLRAMDPVLDHGPPTVPDPDSIMDGGHGVLSVDSSLRSDELLSRATGRSRRWLAPVCASAVVVAVAAGVLAYAARGRPEAGTPAAGTSSASSTTQTAATTNPGELIATSWELTQVIDPSGTVPSAASAPVVFTFTNNAATDHVGDNASAHVTSGQIEFGTWANDLMLHRGPRLDIAQSHFVYGKLDDSTVTWSITGNTLTIGLGGGGSLVFARHTFDATKAFGSLSGQFMAVGGPAGIPSPRPIHGTGTVQLTNTDTGQTQTIDTTTGGSYGTSIVPGTYTVKGNISSYQSGHSTCMAAQPVVVQQDGVTKADVYCVEN